MPESGSGMQSPRSQYASLLSWVRFGPSSILILCAITFLTIEFYLTGHIYLAIMSGAVDLVIFTVKSMEIIQLVHPEERKLTGQRCLVIKKMGKGKSGVVRVYDRTGARIK